MTELRRLLAGATPLDKWPVTWHEGIPFGQYATLMYGDGKNIVPVPDRDIELMLGAAFALPALLDELDALRRVEKAARNACADKPITAGLMYRPGKAFDAIRTALDDLARLRTEGEK